MRILTVIKFLLHLDKDFHLEGKGMSIDKYVEEAQRFSELAKKYGSVEKASEKLGISLKRFYEVLKRLKVENNVLELLKKSGKKISRKHLETLGRMPPKMQ
ncbi:hypothetical protein DRN63_03335 [Nanoarchaeota archaeon]|nr:MAG: hypothetical protein DRN63_03335 [Nanoarchaeota archaeon]